MCVSRACESRTGAARVRLEAGPPSPKPASGAQNRVGEPGSRPITGWAVTTVHVLVCDDDASTRFVLRRFLSRQYGCQVTECDNGQVALALLGRLAIDLVVLDLNMPVLDGLSTLRAIRTTAATAHLRVLILTEDRSEAVVRRVAALGVSGFSGKPLSAPRLRERFDQLLLASEEGEEGRARGAQ